MSHSSMFYPTKANAKLANINMGYTEGIGIIFQMVTSESLEHCGFVDSQGHS